MTRMIGWRRNTNKQISLRALRQCMEAMEGRVMLSAVTWTGAISNAWENVGNWSNNAVPGASDDVTIPAGKSVTISSDDAVASINTALTSSLDINSGSLTLGGDSSIIAGGFTINATFTVGSGAVTLSGQTSWTGGNINLGGSNVTAGNTLTNTGTMTITAAGVFLASSNGNSAQLGGEFDNQSTIVQPSGSYSVADGVTILNEGTYDFTGGAQLSIFNGNSRIVNISAGLIEKTTDSSTATLGLPLYNQSGTIEADDGTLSLANNGRNIGGTYNAMTGATIDLTDGQEPTYVGTYSGSGGGNINLGSGTLDIGSGGADFDFPAGMFNWSGGNIDLAGDGDASGNTLTNGGSITITNAGGFLASSNGGHGGQLGGTLDNKGTIKQLSGHYSVADGVSILNEGTYNFTGDADLDFFNGASNIINPTGGVIQKSAGTGTSTITLPLNNQGGRIEADTGTLSLANSGTSTGGNYLVDADATINLTGGQQPTLSGAYTASGGGALLLNGGTLFIGSGGASFNFPTGMFTWSGGNIDLAGSNVTAGNTLTNLGTISITNSGGLLQSSNGSHGGQLGGELDNQGTIFQPSGGYSLADDVTLLNEKIYDFTGDSNLGLANGTSNITNTSAGTIEKTSGTGSSLISLTLNNQGGKIEADTGTLTLNNNGVDTGGNYVAAAGAIINITGGAQPTWSGTYIGSGGGAINLASGTLFIGSNGASFNFPAGLFTWSGGNINLAGSNVTTGNTLTNLGTITSTSAGGILASSNGHGGQLGGELDNQGTIFQPSGGYSLADGVTLLNEKIYDFTGDSNLGITNGASNITNTSTGTIEKTTGTGSSLISLTLNNQGGKIEADTGTLTLNNNGVDTGGNYVAATGAIINITGGAQPTWSGTYTGSGGGAINLASGTLFIGSGGASFNFPAGLFTWAGGNIDLAGSNVTAGNTLTNLGTITITDSGGLLQSSNGQGGQLGGELDNQGTIFQPSGNYGVADGVEIKNENIYDFNGDSALGFINGVSNITNTSSGTIEKTNGTNTSSIGLTLNNQGGKIEANTGTLTLNNNGVDTGGNYVAAAGAIIDITGGGQPTWTGTYTGSGAGAVNLASGALLIGLGGATFNFPAGLFTWSGGNIDLVGSNVTVGNTFTNLNVLNLTASGSFLYSSNGNGSQFGGTLDNKGTILQSSGNINLADGVSILNEGTYNFAGDASLYFYNGSSSIVNLAGGLVEKTAGTGTSTITLPLDNEGGTLQASSGTIALASNNTTGTGGTFNAATGATIDLTGGASPTFTGTYTGSGGGTVLLDAGTLNLGTGGATFNFAGNLFQWTGGNINSGFGDLINLGTINLSGSGDRTFYNDGTIDNKGTIIQGADANLGLHSDNQLPTTLLNEAGATYEFLGDSGFDNPFGGETAVDNDGIMKKVGGTGTTTLLIPGTFTNNGTLDIETGTLTFSNCSVVSATGAITVAGGATLDMTGNTTIFYSGLFKGTGAGTIALSDGELAIADGGATFNFIGNLFQWTGGGINLAGRNLTNTAAMNLNFSSAQLYANQNYSGGNGQGNIGGQLINDGTIIQQSGTLATYDSIEINNAASGIYQLTGDGGFNVGNDSPTIVNAGTFEKTGGTGTSTIAVPLTNTGTILVSSGTLSLTMLSQLSNHALAAGGTWEATSGATLALPAGITSSAVNLTMNGATSHITGISGLTSSNGDFSLLGGASFTTAANFTNSGTLTIGPGSTFTVSGTFTQTSAGTLDIQLGGAPSGNQFGQLVSTHAATLAGTLQSEVIGNYSPIVGDSFTVATFPSATGSFSTQNLASNATYTFIGVVNAANLVLTANATTSDLGLLSIDSISPGSLAVGQTVTIDYTAKNFGLLTPVSAWNDSIFLSPDATLDSNAVLIGRVSHSGALAAGATYQGALTANVPGLLPGTYYVIVEIDSGNVVGDKNRTNNVMVTQRSLTLPTLAIGGTPAAGTIAASQSAYYQIDVPADSNTQIALTSTSPGAAVLLDQYLALPTIDTFAQKSFSASTSTQEFTISSAAGGTYYILVYGQAPSATNFTLSATTVPFAISSIGPTSAANVGNATITIAGTDFSSGSTANLILGSTTLSAAKVQFVNSNTLYATFNLSGAPAGNYDVQVSDSGSNVSLPAALAVAPGSSGQLQVTVSMPSAARVDRNFTALVTYTNTGLTDLVSPIIQLYSPTSTLMTLDLTAQPSQTTIQFFAVGKKGPAGILEAGESETVQVLVLQNEGSAEIDPSDIDSTNTTAMSWAYAQDSLTVTYQDDAQFQAVLNQIESSTGTTWGTYDAMLAGNATLMPAAFGDPSNLDDDLRLEYQRIAATITPSITGNVTSSSRLLRLTGNTVEAFNSTAMTSYSSLVLNDGSFIFPEVADGNYTFMISGAAVASTNPSPVTVADAPVSGVTINAVPEISATGMVTDASGNPISGASLYIFSGTTLVNSTITDASGRYTISNFAPGTYDFVVNGGTSAQTEHDNVTLSQPTTVINFALGVSAQITGKVTFTDNSAPPNLFALASLSNEVTPMSLFTALGNADGSFDLTNLPAGTYNISFVSGSNTTTISGITVAGGQTIDIGVITLPGVAAAAPGNMLLPLSVPTGLSDAAQFLPGQNTPLLDANDLIVVEARNYLDLTWLPAAFYKWGIEDQLAWDTYLDSTSLNPPVKTTFGAGSDIVEGSSVAGGFRQVDENDQSENQQVKGIETAVEKDVQQMFANGQLSCDGILSNAGTYTFALDPSVFPDLITPATKTTTRNLLINDTNYNGILNIPGNFAGGIGKAADYKYPGSGIGQQYDDNRYVEGSVIVTLANNGQVSIHYNISRVINDTIDFLPGDPGAYVEQIVTRPMMLLESVGQAFDNPFRVEYRDFRFMPQTFAITVNPPVCPDPTRPPPPTQPQPQPDNTNKTKGVDSHDPNDIIGPSGFIDLDQTLPYTIDFENESTATAPAQIVTITQQLSSNLDWSTFQLGDVHFGNYNVAVPSGLMSYSTQVDATSDLGVLVDVAASFNSQTGLATWTFTSIDPTTLDVPSNPLEGFLPPDVTSQQGEGFVSYSVKPKSTLTTGDSVSAEATVVFDTNAPINTPQITASIDLSPPTSTVLPMPAYQTAPNFTVAWTGNDTGGSGIADFDIYVSTDGGSFTPWLTDTTATSATYNGAVGHVYSFYSIAHDLAGNIQATPSAGEAQTNIVSPTRVLTFGGKTKATYTDSAGHIVTISLSGSGTGTIGFLSNNPADPVQIILNGTTAKSSLTIKVAGNAATNITDIQINGSLGKFTATTANFTGVMTVTGTLGALTIHNVIGSISSITVSGSSVATIYKFASIQDLTITSASSIKQFSASSWTATGSFTDSLTAPSIASFKIAGNFDANLTLTAGGLSLGAFSAGAIAGGTWTITGSAKSISAGSISNNTMTLAAIATMKLAGNLTNTDITLTAGPSKSADLTSFTVTGSVANSQIRSAGNIGKATVGSMSNSLFFAGVNSSITALPTSASDFAAPATILSFISKGTATFSNSQIAAATIDVVQLHNVTTNNNATPFGIATSTLKSFALFQPSAKPFTWTSKQPPSALANLPGDLKVSLF